MAKKQQAGFRLSGHSLVLGGFPPIVKNVVRFLETLPFGDLISKQELSSKVNCSAGSLLNYASFFSDHAHVIGQSGKKMKVYGHPKTIEALRKEIAERQ